MARALKIDDRPCLRALFITDPTVDKLRIENSKGPLLRDATDWILETDDFQTWKNPKSNTRLLWIHGEAGMGKTMLVCAILDELRKPDAANDNLAFFFCESNNGRTRSAEAALRGLLFMLATKPERSSVIKCIRDKYNDAGSAIFEGPNAWWSLKPLLSEALGAVGQSQQGAQSAPVTYLVIDALDECEEGLEHLLQLISESSSFATPPVKWLVTSRGRNSIRRSLQINRAGPARGFDLDDHSTMVSAAVEKFIRHRALALADTKSENDHLYQQIRTGLQKKKTKGGFLHVSLVARELAAVELERRLDTLNKLAVGVKGLYRQAEERIRDFRENGDMGDSCQRTLSAVAVAYRPLRQQELCALTGLDCPENQLTQYIIDLCEPFFVIGSGQASLVHESAREYLQHDSLLFTEGLKTEHHLLFSSCLEVMGKFLRRDMGCLSGSRCQCPDRKKGEQTEICPMLAAAEYACDYWIEHLVASGQHNQETRDEGALFGFLQSKFLFWLEYLARVGRMGGVLSSWGKLVEFVKEKPGTGQLAGIVIDAQRFIAHNVQIITEYPVQVYTSALVFAPTRSRVKDTYWKEAPEWVSISSGTEQQDWSPWLQTIDVDDFDLKTIRSRTMAFSSDSNHFASALGDGRKIKVWDATTGQCLHTLNLDGGKRAAWIVFPCKGSTPMAVGVKSERQRQEQEQNPKTIIHFWETTRNQWDKLFSVNSAIVASVAAFSPDGIWLAAADNNHIDIWDWARGDRTLRFPHSRETPHAMAYAPISANLLASAHNTEVRIWNPKSGEALRSVGCTAVDLIAFSFHGEWLVVANNASLRTWDSRTEEHLQTLDVPAHDNYISPVALSANGSRFVAAPDEDIRIWDVATRRRLSTFGDYYKRVVSLALSPDGTRLASAGDSGLKIWDFTLDERAEKSISQASRDHRGDIFAIAVAANGTRMMSASEDAVKVWNIADGKCIWHRKFASNSGIDPDSGSGSDGGAQHVALSHDGTRLALMPVNGDKLQIWDLETTTRDCQTIPYIALAPPSFSPDGSRIAFLTVSRGSVRVKVWKFDDGGRSEVMLKPDFEPKPLESACVVFAPDSNGLAVSVGDVVAVWGAISPEKKHVQLLPPRADKAIDTSTSDIKSFCFSSDGEHIAVSHKNGEIRIWNLQHATCLETLRMPGGNGVDLIAFTIGKTKDSTVSRATSPSAIGKAAISTISKAACFSIGRAPTASTCTFHFLTNVGVVTYDVTDPTSLTRTKEDRRELCREGYGINFDRGWITNGSEGVLVLPPDYRPRCVAVVPAWSESAVTVAAIAIGCRSGRVASLCFPS